MEPHDPPPPYSETDTFSAPPGQSPVIGTGSDDASLAASSVIFTPPDTPRESHRSFNEGPHDPTRREPSAPSNASAQAYFESRSVGSHWHRSSPNPGLTLTPIVLTERTTPAELPFPPSLLHSQGNGFDITEQDWQTFTNYLLPDHASQANSHIIDRKLRDEAASNSGGRASSDLAEAQLGQIRPEIDSRDNAERNRIARDTVQEWNAGFFGPRGVNVQLNIHERPNHTPNPTAGMPGAWLPEDTTYQYSDPSPYHQAGSSPQGNSRSYPSTTQSPPGPPPFSTSDAAATSQPQGAGPASFSGWNPFGQSGVLRFGPVVIDGDRVAVGSNFVADSSGVKWKGKSVERTLEKLVPPFPGASSSSSQYGGSHHQTDAPWRPNPNFHRGGFDLGHGHEQIFHGRRGSGQRGGRGRGWGGWGGSGHCHPHQHGPSSCTTIPGQEQGVSQVRGSEEDLNPNTPDHMTEMDSACSEDDASSISEESSVSSSSSDSSVGSLPDYDDLRDSQLPVVKQNISVWLAHPQQPVTRDMIEKAKAEIKTAKRKHIEMGSSSTPSTSDNGGQQEEKLPPPPTYDETQAAQTVALREEVKALMTAWQGLKRAQRQQRKTDKKVRRAQRKAAKKERRAKKKADRKVKRAIKAANKAQRKQERDADRRAVQHNERTGRHAEKDEQHLARQMEQRSKQDKREQQRRDAEQRRHNAERQREERRRQHELERNQRQQEREQQQQQRERMRQWQQPGSMSWSPFNQNQHSQQPFGVPNFPFGPGGSPFGGQQSAPFLGRGGNAWQGRGGPWGHNHHAPHPSHPPHPQAYQASHSFSGNTRAQHIPGAWPEQPHQQWRDNSANNLSSSDDSHDTSFGEISMNDNDQDDSHSAHGVLHQTDRNVPLATTENSKYEAIDHLEAQIAEKIAYLSLLGDHIAKEQIEAAKRGEGDIKNKPKTSEQVEAEALERDMELLMKDVERLKVEADEETARRLSREG